MGFGLIFIGYLFTVFDTAFIVNDSLLLFAARIMCLFGYAVLLFGLRKYARYSVWAKYSMIGCSLMCAFMAAEAVLQGLWHFGACGDALMYGIRRVTFPMIAAVFAAAQITLMYAIFDTGRETECDKVKKAGIRSVAATAAFCLINFAAALPFSLGAAFDAVRYGLFVALTIMNAVTVYTAYRYICLDTELEAERAEALKERTFKKDKK
ncbi:MAG: hypothetical protein J5879_02085 [Clostridia bacterium]|nr:hypothetical protein [Clostridia bacterium]